MTLDFGVTVALFSFLVGIPVIVYFTNNFYDRYEQKITRTRTALLGSLGQPIEELRGLSIFNNDGTEESQDNRIQEFMTFMHSSVLQTIIWDYHDLRQYQRDIESSINRILFLVPFFTIPGIVFQIDSSMAILGFILIYILSLIIMSPIVKARKTITGINKLFGKYVIDREYFGDYDR
jgi:hypothetical protein